MKEEVMMARPMGSVERLIPRPMTKIPRDLWSRELLLRVVAKIGIIYLHDLCQNKPRINAVFTNRIKSVDPVRTG